MASIPNAPIPALLRGPTVPRLDPSTKFVRSLDGEYYLLREVAQMLGVNHRVLRKLNDETDDLGPSFFTMFGRVKIYLYTKDDINALGEYLNARRTIYPISEDKTRPM